MDLKGKVFGSRVDNGTLVIIANGSCERLVLKLSRIKSTKLLAKKG